MLYLKDRFSLGEETKNNIHSLYQCIITLNFNIMQTVQSSQYSPGFTKNCSHLFFFARHPRFSFCSFCKSSSNFCFLSVPSEVCSRLVVLVVYFSGCFSLQLLVSYLLVSNQSNHLQQIYSTCTSQFCHQFKLLLLSYYSSLILLLHFSLFFLSAFSV